MEALSEPNDPSQQSPTQAPPSSGLSPVPEDALPADENPEVVDLNNSQSLSGDESSADEVINIPQDQARNCRVELYLGRFHYVIVSWFNAIFSIFGSERIVRLRRPNVRWGEVIEAQTFNFRSLHQDPHHWPAGDATNDEGYSRPAHGSGNAARAGYFRGKLWSAVPSSHSRRRLASWRYQQLVQFRRKIDQWPRL